MRILRHALPAALLGALMLVPAADARRHVSEQAPGKYQVGIGKRTIAVNDNGTWNGQPVYLGGFGLGGPPIGDRHATGNLGAGPSVRAIAISDEDNHNFAIAD